MKGPALHERLLARLSGSLRTLPDKPEESAESTLRALCWAAAGRPRSAEWAAEEEPPPPDAEAEERLVALVERRLAGEPLAHLTGRQRFLGLELEVGGDALIPRKETELLARVALGAVRGLGAGTIVVDLCTGSGNLALALAHHAPDCRVYAGDLSEATVRLARDNARRLGLTDRVEFRVGDLTAPFETDLAGRVDVLVCNPPYVSSAKVGTMEDEIARFEPPLAFDGGPLGVGLLRRLAKETPRLLAPRAWLCLEVGLGQGRGMMRQFERMAAFSRVHGFPDEAGAIRALAAMA